ncbi:uncharacterized protein AB675_9040 [Cyphellophora attinorum]|uniref:Uncharacterized protein n=1 Tax=Cyphellophora attinorum TaxID=1664694 RepID=A0A0N0NNI0_9EURO|nr:uncharacterized protein AB675_9040 [Phialophora attinorum]KPI41399.1 hypothetical protein AB675_9040 [Phialophora attinorum]
MFSSASSSDSSNGAGISPVVWIIPVCIAIFFTLIILTQQVFLPALGRYRQRKGYSYKYWFDIVPTGHKWLAGGSTVFQVTQDKWAVYKLVPLKVPAEGIMMVIKAEDDEESVKDEAKEVEVA